ncbi:MULTISPECIES: hypothetical protein [unclassified Nonomuraea]|uniref:hypothetical protein n=1 Tax=unclassified Nonomuraea TaxID=2593643 RepID=UPI0033EC5C62
MQRYKTWLIRAVIVFAAFYLLTRPANAAEAVNSAFDGVLNGATQLAVFFNHIAL